METRDQYVLHPFIGYIKHRLEALLEYVDLESDGQVIHPESFRLKNLDQWTVGQWSSVADALGSFSSYCNANCIFCYERGNPLPYQRTLLTLEEARTRAAYYDPASGRGLPHVATRLSLEPLVNPKLPEILELIRERCPTELIALTTNGSLLTPDLLDQLARLHPVCLVISVNHADPVRRREVMRDPHAAETLEALPLLRERHIPFVGSVVSWPTIPPEELAATLRFIDSFQPISIRVALPGYNRFFSEEELFDTHTVWQSTWQFLEALRPELRSPLFVVPSLYAGLPLIPRIDGIIPQSIAERSGLRYGDLVVSIDGEPVYTRRQARLVLEQAEQSVGRAEITVERAGERLTMVLQGIDDPSVDLYPYKPLGWMAPYRYANGQGAMGFGLLLNQDIELRSLTHMIEVIRRCDAQRVLLLTSEIMGPIISSLLTSVPEFAAFVTDESLHMVVPRHAYWGGNIMMGDLYMVSDYLLAAQEFIRETGEPPDLILLPATFASEFGRDLLGVPYMEIERQLDIPVELLPCPRIMT